VFFLPIPLADKILSFHHRIIYQHKILFSRLFIHYFYVILNITPHFCIIIKKANSKTASKKCCNFASFILRPCELAMLAKANEEQAAIGILPRRLRR
jgi:hypothetical protein